MLRIDRQVEKIDPARGGASTLDLACFPEVAIEALIYKVNEIIDRVNEMEEALEEHL